MSALTVHVEDADHLIGRIVPVQILSGAQNSLSGTLSASGVDHPVLQGVRPSSGDALRAER